ncbi:MAG: Gfo/Idh/MocA family oxidoreductase [Verrucomicrobiales bacterium]
MNEPSTDFRPAISRRRFIRAAALTGSAPLIVPQLGFAQEKAAGKRLTMGFIGVGKQNGGLMRNFIRQPDVSVVAVCDVDTTRREHALKTVRDYYAEDGKAPEGWAGCEAYVDFRDMIARDDIDAVCIATPDHWHAIITLAALRSGKDVYCEKPLTHNIHEAIEVMNAVDENGRVLQTGSMQRSMKEFRVACELVLNGHIGKVERVECNFGDPGVPCDLPEEEMEAGLDWNMWVGPAPMRPYNSILSPRGVHDHFPSWRDYREFGGGMVTDWGAHHLDIAQWGLGMDASGPVESRPPAEKGAKRGATLVYANGVTVTHGGGIGVHFFGTEGEVEVTRGRFHFVHKGETKARFLSREDRVSLDSQLQKAEKDFLGEAPKIQLYRSDNHLRDFLTCVETRKKPITHEGVGGRSAICCHLMNLAYYHGQTIKWDPATNTFTEGTGDPKWLTRDYRDPWKV